ncbi:MAG: hypothetical protein WAM39_28825 [Bryobacteraceae bacterium]
MQLRALREYVGRRGWMIALRVREVGSGGASRGARQRLLQTAGGGKWEVDVALV